MRAYGFGFCVIEGGFIVLIALNWGEGDALRGVLLAWLAVHIFLSLPIIAAIPGSILGHIYERKGRAQLAAWRAANEQKALNEQEVEKTKAETKRIKAQGEADANKVLNDSLTDNVLRQHYIDALQNADQLIVTPRGIQHPHPTQVRREP